MARTTAENVQLVIDDYDENVALTVFIDTASLVVDDIVAAGATYGATKLEMIERWLAAHFYSVRDRRLVEEKTGDADGVYERTTYWQAAETLDQDGYLGRLKRGLKQIGMYWLGSEDQSDE